MGTPMPLLDDSALGYERPERTAALTLLAAAAGYSNSSFAS